MKDDDMRKQKSYRIVWLDDEPKAISTMVEKIRNQKKLEVTVVPDGNQALDIIGESPPPDLFLADLMLKHGNTGLSVAKTARRIRPLMPIAAVTEHLPQFYDDIAQSLVRRNFPFSYIWEKDDLRDGDSPRFLDTLDLLCRVERHIGMVNERDSEFTRVTLCSPTGEEYERFFESAFLVVAG